MIKYLKHYKVILTIVLIAFFSLSVYPAMCSADETPDVDAALIEATKSTGPNFMIRMAEGAFLFAIGEVIEVVMAAIGALISLAIKVVMVIASYDNFVNEDSVVRGWTQVRNLANMFFILILLVISFATILRVENYNIKRLLPKLIIMAVLVNFSRMICGIIIEFAQVIMMTFINVIDSNGSGFINLLGVQHFLEMVKEDQFNATKKIDTTSTLIGYFLALIFLVVSLVVLLAFMGVLLMRMVMIWVYVVLSPLAYILAAFPQGQGYASRWWDEFVKYVVTGPILAFFLWLAVISAGMAGSITTEKKCYGPSEIVCLDSFLNFIIGIGMLVGGLMITSQVGGIVGSAAGKGLSRIQTGKNITVNFAKNRATDTGKAVGRGALGAAGYGLQKISTKDSGINKAGQLASNWGSDLKTNRVNAQKSARLATLKKMGMGEKSMGSLKDVADSKLGRGAKTGVAAGAAVGAAIAGAPVVGSIAVLAAAIQGFKSKKLKGQEGDKKTVDDAKKARSESTHKADDAYSQATDSQRKRRDARVAAAATTRNSRLSAAETQYNSGAINKKGYDMAQYSIQKTYNDQKRDATTDYEGDSEVTAAKNTQTTAVATAEAAYKSAIGNISEDIKVGDWHPNKVTMGATKDGVKEVTAAKNLVNKLGSRDENAEDYNKGTYYSASGQTSSQKKFFEQLTAGNIQSADAIAHMVSTMSELEQKISRGEDISKGQKESIQSLKQGIAAYKKNGGDASSLSGVVNVVNNIQTGDGSDQKHNKTVQDFESSVS